MGRRNVKRPSASPPVPVAAPTVAVDVINKIQPPVVAAHVESLAQDDPFAPVVTTDRDVECVLSQRESALAAGEADLAARRREAAKTMRRNNRHTNVIDGRLAGIESMIAELAHAMVANRELAQPSDASIDQAWQQQVDDLHDALDALTHQNEELASQLAQSAMRQSIGKSDASDATLTWEQRKAMLFAQDEVASDDHGSASEAALRESLERLRGELNVRDSELSQLRELLEQRPAQAEEGTAVGAAAIAQMMDADELVREERERLQSLQIEWEAKFRKMEISASIERANLARERQQLEKQNVELEEQLAHLRRELRQEAITGPNQSRRWFAKLGLAE